MGKIRRKSGKYVLKYTLDCNILSKVKKGNQLRGLKIIASDGLGSWGLALIIVMCFSVIRQLYGEEHGNISNSCYFMNDCFYNFRALKGCPRISLWDKVCLWSEKSFIFSFCFGKKIFSFHSGPTIIGL